MNYYNGYKRFIIIIKVAKDIITFTYLTKARSKKTGHIMAICYMIILIIINNSNNMMAFWHDFDYAKLLFVISQIAINEILQEYYHSILNEENVLIIRKN